MIDEYCRMCDDLFETLLDVYQMKDWKMTQKEFITQAQLEINTQCEKWKNEEVEEDDNY